MVSLFRKLWHDDKGAVLTSELILITAITVLGAIPGLVALRNAENASLATLANSLLAIQTSFSFSGYEIVGTNGTTIAVVGGAFVTNTTGIYFTAANPGSIWQVTSASIYVSPAP